MPELDVTNPRAAKHPGGAWDLGDPGSVFIRDLSIELATDVNNLADVWGSTLVNGAAAADSLQVPVAGLQRPLGQLLETAPISGNLASSTGRNGA